MREEDAHILRRREKCVGRCTLVRSLAGVPSDAETPGLDDVVHCSRDAALLQPFGGLESLTQLVSTDSSEQNSCLGCGSDAQGAITHQTRSFLG